jgi:hypothetical protein
MALVSGPSGSDLVAARNAKVIIILLSAKLAVVAGALARTGNFCGVLNSFGYAIAAR